MPAHFISKTRHIPPHHVEAVVGLISRCRSFSWSLDFLPRQKHQPMARLPRLLPTLAAAGDLAKARRFFHDDNGKAYCGLETDERYQGRMTRKYCAGMLGWITLV